MKKKLLAMLLTVCMVVTLLPTVALAADPSAPTVSGTGIFGNGVALIIDGSSDTSTTVYIDANRNGTVDSGEQSLAEAGIANAPANGSNLSSYTVFGGAAIGTITGDSMITINGGKVGSVYGGNQSNYDMPGGVTITMNGGNVARLLACGYNDDVGGTGKTVSVSIHGGTVRGDSDDDINLYARNNAETTSLIIDGGMINGNIAVKKTGASFVIKGGNILATYTTTVSNDQYASPTDGTNPVHKTTLTLKDSGTLVRSTAVSALTTDAGYTYGMTDVATNANGNLFVYLPAGKTVTAATTAGGTYTGSVTTLNTGSASGDLTKGVTPPALWTAGLTADANYTFDGGTGVVGDPYKISTATHLAQLAANVNAGSNYAGKYFKLTADIDLTRKHWAPIGTSAANSFQGSFDGGGKAIGNMTINASVNADYQGLFGYAVNGTFSNCSLTGVSITGAGGVDHIGAMIGRASGVTVKDCTMTGTIVGTVGMYIGGAIGSIDVGSSLSRCLVDVDVTVTNSDANVYAGGIVGNAEWGLSLYDCACLGDVAVTGNRAGGIAGNMYSGGTWTNVYYAGNVSATSGAGAFLGYFTNRPTITNCYYLSTCGATDSGGTSKTAAEMAIAGFATTLGTNWAQSSAKYSGYPYPVAPISYNTPDPITANGVTATVSYAPASPQAADTSVTATVTLSGTATAAGTHTVGLASAADITGGVTAPSTVTKAVTANQVMAATDKFEFTFTMPAQDVADLVVTHTFVATLTGTVTITGTEKYGSELTATVTGSNNTGTLSYQWKRGTTNIGTNSNQYTLVANDIGQTITCEVTSSVETGTLTSSATGAIGKADTAAPGAPTLSAKTHNSITVTANTLHEFRLGTDGSWQTSNVFSGLDASTAYTIYARVAATTTNAASPASSTGLAVTTDSAPVNALTGTISISGTEKYNHILTADTTGITNNTGTLSYQWKRGGTDGTNIGGNQAIYTLVEADINSVITCIVTSSEETGTISNSTGTIGKADGPIAPTGLVGVKPSVLGVSDGKITNTTALMQYSDNAGFTSPNTCGASETTGLAAGTYYVRVAATTTTEAGEYATVTVPAGGGDTPTYTATVSPDSHTFPAQTAGYSSVVPPTFTITNTGTGNLTNLDVQFTTSSSSFELYTASVAATVYGTTVAGSVYDSTTTFTVKPIIGLAAGSYSAQVQVTAAELTQPIPAPWVYFTVTPASSPGRSGGSSTPTVSVPVSGSDTVRTSVAVSNRTAAISLSGSQLTTVLGTGVDNVTVDVTSLNNIEQVSIPAGVVEQLAAADDVSLTLESDTATIVLDSATLDMAAALEGDLRVVAAEVEPGSLTASQQTQAGDQAIVVDLQLWKGNTQINDFDGGKASVSLPYELKEGEEPAAVTVWHLAEDGTMTEIPCTYDPQTKLATFTVSHFSLYMVGVGEGEQIIIPVTPAVKNPFNDVKSSDWFYEAVLYVYEKGLMKGTASDTFSPYLSTDRGMIVTILWLMENEPQAANTMSFTDVGADKYYCPAVAWAAGNGIVQGYAPDTFAPEDTITREQLATILYNYADWKGLYPKASGDLTRFSDANQISPWANASMSWANGAGLINGVGGDRLDPTGQAQRCQTASILQGFMQEVME